MGAWGPLRLAAKTAVVGSPLYQASITGDKLGFNTLTPFSGAQSGATGTWLASRGVDGWSTQSLVPPQAHGGMPPAIAYSPDLSKLLMLDGGRPLNTDDGQDDPPLVSGEPANNVNLFLRDNSTGSYQLMNATTLTTTDFRGASTDLSHVLFDDAQSGSLYQWSRGTVSVVSQIPSGSATSCGSGGPACAAATREDFGFLGDNSQSYAPVNAVSSDGSRIFFSSAGQLYVREDGARTVEVSASQKTNGSGPGGADPNGPRDVRYAMASPDGSKVFFSTCDQLTNDATATASGGSASVCNGGEVEGVTATGLDLYQYDTYTGSLTDLSVDHRGDPLGADVQGVLGSSTDGSYVYFVANGVLANGASLGDCLQGGGSGCSLYVAHDGITRFIARLDGRDATDWNDFFGSWTTRVTPDGMHLAFDSTRSLTGFDNRDTATGLADNEVYLYDAGTGQLACASCNPSGAQPTGDASILPTIKGTFSSSLAFYLPRNLSDDGRRLFFETTDALVPGDSNGKQDVYEYAGGRPRLISSGTSGVDSSFFDASLSGNDVFFETAAQLVGQDTDRKLDIYDARVGGGFPSVSSSVPCAGDACKAPPAVSAPGQAPGSSSFVGPGNPAAVAGGPAARVRVLTRAQRLAKALRVCEKQRRKRRASCRAHARKLYGPKKTARRAGK